MRRAVAVLAAMGLLPAAGDAADSAVLDEDFLEYLAEFESDAENWTWFAPDDDQDDAADDKRSRPKAPPVKAQEKVDP